MSMSDTKERRVLDAMMGEFTYLLTEASPEEITAFTRGIQTDPVAVRAFEAVFTMLSDDGSLDAWEPSSMRQALFERLNGIVEDLFEFLDGTGSEEGVVLAISNHGSEATFEIGWHVDQMGEDYVWDRFTAEVDDVVLLLAEVGYLFDRNHYRCAPKATGQAEVPLYRYHPERYKSYRHFAERIGKLYRQKVEPVAGMLRIEQLQELANNVIFELNDKARLYPRKMKDGHPHPSLVMETENMLAMAYGRFVQAGRQIMDFPPALVDMLANTDIDDIPLNTIKLPYPAQYLHFGPQAGCELEPGWVVDGAYVEQRGIAGDIRFTVTAVPTDHTQAQTWYLFPEAMYTQDFVGEYRSMDIGTAIDTVLSAKLAGLRERMTNAGGDMTANLRASPGADGEAMPELRDVTARLAADRDESVRRRHPAYKAALQLVVNALCYISAYPDDIAAVWPDGTPASLRDKAEHGKGKEIARAKSKLTALGYVPVHICGQRIAEQRAAMGIAGGTHGQVVTHWRRGHWRHQAHGAGRTLRKLIWLMPVVVGSKAHDDEPADGHLYLVS